MPLAEYLASEQAREDVRHMLSLGVPQAVWFAATKSRISEFELGAWIRMMVTVDRETISAFYRPDGDRYVVTDLGEGVRALRLRTGEFMAGWENWADGVLESVAGVIRIRFVTADDLPDAICRVMLASLKVAGGT